MELNEVIRRLLVGRRLLILACLVVTVGTMLAISLSKAPSFSSTARLQASATAPGSDTEADSILNRVTGIATSPREVDNAMQAAGINGIPAAHFIHGGITVSRLGSSAVFDMSVNDSDPAVARALTGALASDVVNFLNTSGNHQVNSLMSQLGSSRVQLVKQRQLQASALARATKSIDKANLSAEVGTLDQEIGDLDSSLRELAVNTAAATSAVLISDASPAQAVPGHLATDLALAAIIAVVGGLLCSMLLEMVRPRLAGGRAFARELGIPLLGALTKSYGQGRRSAGSDINAGGVVSPTSLLAIRAAAARHSVSTVVLVGTGSEGRMHHVTTRLNEQLSPLTHPAASRESPTSGQVTSNGHQRPAPGTNDHHLAAGSLGLRLQERVRTVNTTSPRLIAVSLSEDAALDTGSPGIIFVVHHLIPYLEAQRLGDLAAATGWTVLGVLDEDSRRTKGKRHDR